MSGTIDDLRYAARMLLSKPAFSIIAIMTLALGIGANSAVFSVVKSVLLEPLPYPDSDRLVQFHIYLPTFDYEQNWIVPGDAADWREHSKGFGGIGVYRYAMLNFSTGDLPEAVYGLRVSSNLLPLLGVSPALGRYFTDEEELPGSDHVIILSDELWRTRFNSDPGIIGQRIVISQESFEVVGVMPPGFNFPLRLPMTAKLPSQQMGYWYPLGFDIRKASRNDGGYSAIARLKPGISLDQARSEMVAVSEEIARENPQRNIAQEARLVSLKEQTVGEVRLTLFVLFGAVGLVVLIACANVASLLLVRAESRRQEIFIRQSLGATRWRLARQLLTESMLLSFIGGSCGVLIARWALPVLLRLTPQSVPRLPGTQIDLSVLAFTLLVCVLAGLLFGLAPALRTQAGDMSAGLKQSSFTSSARRGRVGTLLIVAEVALALLLTLSASLLLNSFVRLLKVDPGFDADKVLACVVLVPNSQYSTIDMKLDFFRRVIERVEQIPGVESAAASDTLPFSGQQGSDQVRIEGQPELTAVDPSMQAEESTITAGFIETMGIQLVNGRSFSEKDTSKSPPVAVISEAAASYFWPGQDPIGKRLSLGLSNNQRVWREVVGVVRSTHNAGVDLPPRPHVYVPVEQAKNPSNFLLVRSTLPPSSLTNAVKAAVASVDKNQPVFLTAPMASWIGDSIAKRRFSVLLLGVFGGLALMLASVGIYGVLSHTVGQRTREMGIRIALGARPRQITRLILRDGMLPALAGISIGLASALALTRLLRSLLYQVQPNDPTTFATVSFALMLVAGLACWLPARRAAKSDPLKAIRHE